MKVAYIMTKFPALSETFAANDVKALKEIDVDVSVFAQRAEDRLAKKMIRERGLMGVPSASCGKRENFIGLACMFINPSLALQAFFWIVSKDLGNPKHMFKCILLLPASFYILRRLKLSPPDVVHLFWGHYPAVVGYLVRRRLSEVKLSMFLGAYDLEYKMGISRNLALEADCIFTHAKVNLPALTDLGIESNRVEVVYRGVSVDGFMLNVSPFKENINGKWISAGRLMESKGFGKLLKLFSMASDENLVSRLVIAGDGPDKKNLEDTAQEIGLKSRIEFIGHVDQQRLFSEMTGCDFFILLSTKMGERLPNVIKEAMLAGCICITTRSPGIEELICHGKTGFLVDGEDLSSVIRTIQLLTPNDKEEMRLLARKTIREKFDVQKSMNRYLKVWNSL